MSDRPLKIGFIVGEESGDLIAADLLIALRNSNKGEIAAVGLGGTHLAALGLKSWFDPSEIALMGFSAIVAKLPSLLMRISKTADQMIAEKPDCLIIIDSPEFSHRVAKKVKAAFPDLPVVNYVCPSVWAWRPGRAPKMKAYIDHILCLLPFEPQELARLNGPEGTYVGHRLRKSADVLSVRKIRHEKPHSEIKTLLILPGSRSVEVKRLAGPMAETIAEMRRLGHEPRIVIPTLPKVEVAVRQAFSSLGNKVEISTQQADKWRFFAEADAALAASGTVTLELALCNIPHASVYKTDYIAAMLKWLFISWSACLPNLIADRPIVPEDYDYQFRPAMHARIMIDLMKSDSLEHAAQMQGFAEVWDRLETEKPAGEIAAGLVLKLINQT